MVWPEMLVGARGDVWNRCGGEGWFPVSLKSHRIASNLLSSTFCHVGRGFKGPRPLHQHLSTISNPAHQMMRRINATMQGIPPGMQQDATDNKVQVIMKKKPAVRDAEYELLTKVLHAQGCAQEYFSIKDLHNSLV